MRLDVSSKTSIVIIGVVVGAATNRYVLSGTDLTWPGPANARVVSRIG